MPETSLWNRRFIFLLIAQAGFGFAHSAFLVLPKFMATELLAGPDQIGIVVAISAISVVLFLLPAGTLVDRRGRRKFLVAGALGMSAASASFVFVDSVGVLLVGLRLAQSLAFAFAFASGGALCVDAAPPTRLGQALGLFGLSFVLMGAVAPALVEVLVASHGWDPAFLAAAGGATLCAILALFVREEPLAIEPGPPVPLHRILTRPEIMQATLVVGLLGVGFGCAMNFHQPYALSLGIVDLRAFFIANSLAAAASRLIVGPFIDRIGLVRVSLGSLGLYSVVLYAMTELDQIGLTPIGLAMGLSHGLFYPAYTAWVLSDCPPSERGRRMSIIQAGMNGGIGGGGIALGFLAAAYGYPAIFRIAAGALVLGCVVIAIQKSNADREARAAIAGGPTPEGVVVKS